MSPARHLRGRPADRQESPAAGAI